MLNSLAFKRLNENMPDMKLQEVKLELGKL